MRALRKAHIEVFAKGDEHGAKAPTEVEMRGGGEGEGAERGYSLLATLVRNGAGTPLGLAVVLRDVSDRVERLNEARRLALLEAADGALYVAKAAGRDRVAVAGCDSPAADADRRGANARG